MARFIRNQSKAALRAIVVTHASSDPLPGSNIAPFLHARSRATCATSSAQPVSPTIAKRSHTVDARSAAQTSRAFFVSSAEPFQEEFV